MKAKLISFFAIIFALVWVASLTLIKAFLPLTTGKDLGLDFFEIIVSGIFFVVIFIPIYLSIWLDKKNQESSKSNNFFTEMYDKLLELAKETNKKNFFVASSPNENNDENDSDDKKERLISLLGL